MTQLEDRLTDLLTRNAEAVEVHPDVQRVLDATALVSLDGTSAHGAGRRHRPFLAAVAATAAVVVLIGVAVLGKGEDDTTIDAAAPPAAPVATAEVAPRLLVTAEGWSVERVQEHTADLGEMGFTDGAGRHLELNWYPAAEHATFLADRARAAEGSWPATIAGHDAVVFQYAGRIDFTALWLDGPHSFELRGSTFSSLEEYLAAVATLEEVDGETWLSALPASIVRPEERQAAVAAILKKLPLPADFDAGSLASGTSNSSQEIGFEVTQAVACAWVQEWVDGTEAGDAAAVSAAADAMASSHEWDVLVENDSDFAEYIWQVADAMATGEPFNGDTTIPTGTGYQRAIGCAEG